MCGILATYYSKNLSKELINKQLDEISHRGPDDFGIYFNENKTIALGSRRLSINDLSRNGKMPMSYNDDYIIVFNGEIYNHLELRKELNNYQFNSKSDTETVLYSYVEWGKECLNRLKGMFSFIIYDKINDYLFIARDLCGEKPLYYKEDKNGITLSSEIKQILADDDFPRKLDLKSLNEFLRNGYLNCEETLIRGIKAFPKASYGIYDIKKHSLEVIPFSDTSKKTYDGNLKSDKYYLQKLDELLNSSVKRQLISDVPLGVFLSGGIDSSLITYYASKNSKNKIKTFNVSFEGFKSFDESANAKKIANELNTEHIEIKGDEISFDIFKEMADNICDPIADSSLIPTYLVSKYTSNYVKVALGGDGGDELFGGYVSYNKFLRNSKRISFIPKLIIDLLNCFGATLPIGFKGRSFLINLSKNPYISFLKNRLFDEYALKKILNVTAYREKEESNKYSAKKLSYKHKVLLNDFHNYMTNNILLKVDRTSMANSLEVRSPFLDKDIIDFSFNKLPSYLKFDDYRLKILIKKLFKEKIKAKVDIERKQGFSIPLDIWINTTWNEEINKALEKLPEEIFNKKEIFKLLRNNKSNLISNSSRIFSLLMLSFWIDKYKIRTK